MEHTGLADPSLTIALALVAGMLAQSLARHLRIPGIVVLLAAGHVLGPDLLGIVRPETLGATLPALVGFAVAVILFEGGMNLDLRRLRREAKSIRGLVTTGALVTAVGASLAAHWIVGWGWTPSILFGTLVIVTGPTVINPLLRRIRVHHKVGTVLTAEGILLDAIGAIVAAVALEVVLGASEGAVSLVAWDLVARLGFGFVFGLVGGVVIALLLRSGRIVPEGFENIFTLACALAIYQVSNAVLPETGIMAVTIAGMAVGNIKTRALGDLKEFKEQLTILFIGLLFVLLAADVRVEQVRALGWSGLLLVAALMLVVRPLNVLVGTWGSDLTGREKLFLSWLAPRGIVAAAVASLFAQSLTAAGIPGGEELRAMVFLVIAATVLVQGLTGGVVAQWLGLRRPSDAGYVILGANDLGRAVGGVLRGAGQEVVFIDSNPDACTAAEKDGFRVLFGNAVKESILQRAELDGRAGCLAITPNDEANLLFARTVREEYDVPRAWVALRRGHLKISEKMVKDAGGRVLFGEARTLDLWTLRLERGTAAVQRWRMERPPKDDEKKDGEKEQHWRQNVVLPIVVERGSKTFPMDGQVKFKVDDVLHVVVFHEKLTDATAWLDERGWRPVEIEDVEDEQQEATSTEVSP